MGTRAEKKHPCADCRQCQWCSDNRCSLCLNDQGCKRKLSIKEQIELYETLNSTDRRNEDQITPKRSQP